MDKKINILLVDDEEKIREMLSAYLISKGYLVEGVSDGEEAIKRLKSSDFNIIITDLRMPQMDGAELIKKARSLKSDIGIIVLTGYGDIDSYIDAMDMGAFEYINKTVSIEDLFDDLCLAINKLAKTLEKKNLPHEGV